MLRKRNRSFQKDQKMGVPEPLFVGDVLNKKHDYNSILKVPGLFVGFNTKYSESDSVRSPTSPLDFRIFLSLGNSFRHPRSDNDAHTKSWGCGKVGLGLADALDSGNKTSGASNMFPDNKSIFLGRQVTVRSNNFDTQVNTPALPEHAPSFPGTSNTSEFQKCDSGVVFEIGEVAPDTMSWKGFPSCALESTSFGIGNSVSENKPRTSLVHSKLVEGSDSLYEGMQTSVQSEAGFVCSIPASEIELSEDYTCVRKHGPNPKVTHIFGDCIFEFHDGNVHSTMINCKDSVPLESYPLDDFLKVCHACNKSLDGEDVYMYRGEIGFCSNSCRSAAMELDDVFENDEIDLAEKPYK